MENFGNCMRDDDESIAPDPAIGFKFVPTEEELIRFFLFRKSMGLPLPGFNPIVEKDLYGDKHPSDVLSDILDSPYWNTTKDLKREMYVYTKLSKVSAGKTRIARTNGHGTWEGQTGETSIYRYRDSTRELIGKRKMLSFTDKKGSKRPSSDRWIMHEFSLAGVLLDNYNFKYKDYVICRITKKHGSVSRSNSDENLSSSAEKRSVEVEEEEGAIVRYNKKQKVTTTFDHEPVDVDEGNKSMAVLVTQNQPHDTEDMLMLTNYSTAHEKYSHADHTDLIHNTIDHDTQLELEGTGNVDVRLSSDQECNHIIQLHNISTKDYSQLGNPVDNNNELEGVRGKSADVLPAHEQSNDDNFDWSSYIEEYCSSRRDDGDELLHDDFHLEDGNGSSSCDNIWCFSEFSMMYDRLSKGN